MYYLLIIFSTIMLGLEFFFNKMYQQSEGSSVEKALIFSMGTAIIKAVVMFIVNGFTFEFTWFSLAVSIVLAINSILFYIAVFLIMPRINLSFYSLITMLGGMLLPFIGGICLWNEPLTVKKLISIVIISFSLFIGVDLAIDRKSLKYCFFVFVLNGIAGIISKWHQSSTNISVSSSGLMLLESIVIFVICYIIMIFSDKNKLKLINIKVSLLSMCGFSLMTGLANLLLLIALIHIAASVQYPMITGGTIIVSTIICFFKRERITYKNIISASLALIATLLLV